MTMGIFLPPGIIPLYAVMSGLGLARTYAGFALVGSGMHLTIGIFVLVRFARNTPKTLDEAAFAEGCGYGRFFFVRLAPHETGARWLPYGCFVHCSFGTTSSIPLSFSEHPSGRCRLDCMNRHRHPALCGVSEAYTQLSETDNCAAPWSSIDRSI